MTYKIKWQSLDVAALQGKTPFGKYLVCRRLTETGTLVAVAYFANVLICNRTGYKSVEHAKRGCHRHFNKRLSAVMAEMEGE